MSTEATTDVRDLPIGSDPKLGSTEKETTLTIPGDTEWVRYHSEIPTGIKWVLSVEESTIEDYRTVDGQIVSVTAKIPKGIVRFQASARKSNNNSNMVSYGDLR